jgi:hypothetical protein
LFLLFSALSCVSVRPPTPTLRLVPPYGPTVLRSSMNPAPPSPLPIQSNAPPPMPSSSRHIAVVHASPPYAVPSVVRCAPPFAVCRHLLCIVRSADPISALPPFSGPHVTAIHASIDRPSPCPPLSAMPCPSPSAPTTPRVLSFSARGTPPSSPHGATEPPSPLSRVATIPTKPPSAPSCTPSLASLSHPRCLLYYPLPLAIRSPLRPEIHLSAAVSRILCQPTSSAASISGWSIASTPATASHPRCR